MEGTVRDVIKGGKISPIRSRRIPKRGHIKVVIVVGLAHSFASIFFHSASRPEAGSHFS